MAVAVGSGLILLLAGFAVIQTVQIRRVTLERDRANSERDHATGERDRATRFRILCCACFRVSNPGEARGNSVTARELLDKASTEIDISLEKDPELNAQMLYTMGDVYDSLGLNSEGRCWCAAPSRPEHPDIPATVYDLGCLEARRGRKDQALALVRQAVDHGLVPDNDMWIERDPDLASLHSDPRFTALVAHAKQVARARTTSGKSP